jgi:hypothetical protein
MKPDGPRRLLVALALLPLLAGVAWGAGPVLFGCPGDRVARAAGCCPDEARAAGAARALVPTLAAARCCDVRHVQARATPAATEGRAVQAGLHLAGSSSSLRMPAAPPSPLGARPGKTLAQPPPTIPILLAKQSFLI